MRVADARSLAHEDFAPVLGDAEQLPGPFWGAEVAAVRCQSAPDRARVRPGGARAQEATSVGYLAFVR